MVKTTEHVQRYSRWIYIYSYILTSCWLFNDCNKTCAGFFWFLVTHALFACVESSSFSLTCQIPKLRFSLNLTSSETGGLICTRSDAAEMRCCPRRQEKTTPPIKSHSVTRLEHFLRHKEVSVLIINFPLVEVSHIVQSWYLSHANTSHKDRQWMGGRAQGGFSAQVLLLMIFANCSIFPNKRDPTLKWRV